MSGIDGRIVSVYECVAWKAENVEEIYPSFIITFEDGTQKVLVATTKEKEEFYRKAFEEMFYITLCCGCKVVRDGDEHRQAIVDIDGKNPICEECYDDEYESDDDSEEDE
jgi:hypothetical protein